MMFNCGPDLSNWPELHFKGGLPALKVMTK